MRSIIKETLKETENMLITIAMAKTSGNKTRAARLLGVPKSTLQRKIEKRKKENK